MIENVAAVTLKSPRETNWHFQGRIEELHRLAETAGAKVVYQFTQTRERPVPATYVGEGKITEIAEWLKTNSLKTVLFEDDLSPAQQKNLEKKIKAKIIDRTRLILDIFAKRARSREGKLQVELAQLNYLVPRLTGSWRGFSQQVGGIGTRGPGERKIEVERRYVRERIKRLTNEISEIQRHRQQMRQSREDVPLPQVALIGYTNVGKSTLLNRLVGKTNEVYADDLLFATLDPTTRRVKLPGGRTVLFTDTVGFIQKLPPNLMAAFRATLEEVTRASLLIHIVDASLPEWQEQRKIVTGVLKELGATGIPIITVFNKADCLSSEQMDPFRDADTLLISGKTGEGVTQLLSRVQDKLDEQMVDVSFFLPHTEARILAHIHRTGYVLSESHEAEGSNLRIRIDPGNWKRIEHALDGTSMKVKFHGKN